jgi:oleate hydratase
MPTERCIHIVGAGIAGLASAAYLIRDGGVPGRQIRFYEAGQPGGSLDASGSAAQGYSMRGSRMFGPAYVLTYELLDAVPSFDDPAKSVAEDTFEFWQSAPWYDRARLVERGGRIVDPTDWRLRNRDRADLAKLMLRDEAEIEGKRIDECFEPAFFESNFWLMWCSMFGFETWHSADELRRYLLRFLRLFPDLETMQIIQSTRYNGHDSIVTPMLRWLQAQGVQFETGVDVDDVVFASGTHGTQAPQHLRVIREGRAESIELGDDDLVILTLGSMTADSSLGSMEAAPAARSGAPSSWRLWQRLAEQDRAFGRPWAFCGQPERTTWITFTVTDANLGFFRLVEAFSGSPAGRGGLVTLKDSSWMLTFHLYPSPAFPGQPEGTGVWWGYGLFPDRIGDFVGKRMDECSGREILVELYAQLGLQAQTPALLAAANCIPCRLPYTTSQFMPRVRGDRPVVLPPGFERLAVVGQYCEIPANVVYTVEYSVQSARMAVAGLLGLPPVPPAYEGLDHPNALVGALRRVLND